MEFSRLLKCCKCRKKICYIFPQTVSEYEDCYWMKIECVACRTGKSTQETLDTKAGKVKRKRGMQTYFMSKKGIRLDIDPNYYFKSTYEANFARILNYLHVSWSYESFTFKFKDRDCSPFSYKPDFVINETNAKALSFGLVTGIYEIKGYLKETAKYQLGLFKKQYPDKAKNLILLISQDSDIEAANKLGFRYRLYPFLRKNFKEIIPNWE